MELKPSHGEAPKDVGSGDADGEARRKRYYSQLYRRLILINLVCSLVPLLLVGWGINRYYTRFATARMTASFETQVDHHRKVIELFLRERSARLRLLAQTHSKEYLGQPLNLTQVFETLNQEYGSLEDLGLIDDQGKHVAYVGPYDLMDKDYSQTTWFKNVMMKGIYISDMFTGWREVPHFIIAILRVEKGERWILRATIDTKAFRSLVENVSIGKTGEVYLLNSEGVYQTSPRFVGKIMEKSAMAAEEFHEAAWVRAIQISHKEQKENSAQQIVATAWLKEPRWMLVVKQDYEEVFGEVNHANNASLVFLLLCAFSIFIITVLTTRYFIKVIRRRDTEADQLNQQLMEAGKMASIGELSAGVAHEINNPLAIILTEKQILLDTAEYTPGLNEEFKKSLKESMEQVDTQVNRCKRITHNLLRFSRRTRSVIERVDLNPFLKEIVDLMEREARSSGIKFMTDLDENLGPVLSDPSQLQQVFLNLITNAIDAHDGKPYGTIGITTRAEREKKTMRIEIADTGCGIPKDMINKIFDPFFTTKPVGKGTGLGLSICYTIMQRLGGSISVKSQVGEGSVFTLKLPYAPAEDGERIFPATESA